MTIYNKNNKEISMPSCSFYDQDNKHKQTRLIQYEVSNRIGIAKLREVNIVS